MRSNKLQQLLKILSAAGVVAHTVHPMWAVPHNARRRITLAAMGTQNGAIVGYHSAGSREIVPIHSCLVARTELIALIPALQIALNTALQPREALDIHVLACDNGIDMAISGTCLSDTNTATRIFNAVHGLPCARISVGVQLQHTGTLPILTFGTLAVNPPPATFMQACAEAEQLMQTLVLDAMGRKSKHIADMFCGIGTFLGVLATKKHVSGYENNAPAVAALTKALAKPQGLKPATVENRDLFRRPLVLHELKAFDGVVLNPPRQGAQAQAEWLAKSPVPRIAYVSCSPTSFVRDAKMLIAGGYRLDWLQPIDQFLWSEHLEVVGCFVK